MRDNEIDVKIENDVGYILLKSTLYTHDTREVRKAFEKLEENDINEVIVDMTNVVQMDSSGIGVLAMYLKKIRDRKGVMKLMYPKEEVKRILKLVNLYNHFEIIE